MYMYMYMDMYMYICICVYIYIYVYVSMSTCFLCVPTHRLDLFGLEARCLRCQPRALHGAGEAGSAHGAAGQPIGGSL